MVRDAPLHPEAYVCPSNKIKLVQSTKMLGTGQHTTDKNELALQCPNIYRCNFWIGCALERKKFYHEQGCIKKKRKRIQACFWNNLHHEEFEDTKGLIKICKSLCLLHDLSCILYYIHILIIVRENRMSIKNGQSRNTGLHVGRKEEFEDTKGIIRIRISKNRQHNGQKKRDTMTNNDLQNITHK